jgi:putative transposase
LDVGLNTKLVEGEFYHLYGRSLAQNGKLFYQARNYDSFLKNFDKYLGAYLDIWAYCLIPNHFHFLVRVKLKVDTTILEKWREFAKHYSQLVNKQENRLGNLFQEPPRFLKIKSQSDLLSMVKYINYNPVYHGLVDKPSDWRYSSQNGAARNRLTNPEINKLMAIFDSRNAFAHYHVQPNEFDSISYCLVDEPLNKLASNH